MVTNLVPSAWKQQTKKKPDWVFPFRDIMRELWRSDQQSALSCCAARVFSLAVALCVGWRWLAWWINGPTQKFERLNSVLLLQILDPPPHESRTWMFTRIGRRRESRGWVDSRSKVPLMWTSASCTNPGYPGLPREPSWHWGSSSATDTPTHRRYLHFHVCHMHSNCFQGN